jgi:hypothetical protein
MVASKEVFISASADLGSYRQVAKDAVLTLGAHPIEKQSILVSRFGDEGISAVKLLMWAILPTAIMGAAFMRLR